MMAALILVDLKSLDKSVVLFLHVPWVDLHSVVLKAILTILATSSTEGVSGCLNKNLMGLNKKAL